LPPPVVKQDTFLMLIGKLKQISVRQELFLFPKFVPNTFSQSTSEFD
jgi:hypothetical protein